MTDLSVLQVSVLGAPKFARAGSPITGFASTKVQALLCYLALTARPHLRDTLVGLLWSEMPNVDAKTNLRQALANLRRLVGDYLLIERDTVTFNSASPHWIDAEEFERLAKSQWQIANANQREQAVRDLQLAISYFRGDLLEGFYVRDAPEFEEWLVTQRERLRQQALQLFHTLVAHHLANHEYARGIDYATRLIALDPWCEEAHQQLIMLYARNRQRGAALAQYDTCRRVLAEKIGVEPSAETTALYERIQAANTMPRLNLPPPVTPFIGRADELLEIAQHLADPGCRLLTLVGPGGIGKTRLALQAASNVAGSYLHGACFVPLAAVNSTDLVVSAIANALQLTPGKGDLNTQLLDYLRNKEMLLVLDNFEHLISSAALLGEILQSAPDVKILATSRERLNVYGETVFRLDGLHYPDEEQSRDTEGCSAVELFIASARRADARFVASDATLPSIIRVCRLLDGLPLGIELAAAWVWTHDCQMIAAEIERGLDFLATTQYGIPERQRSLRAVFEHSWQMLSAEEQRIFRALSVFRGGFGNESAEQVVGATPSALARLVNKSLVRRDVNGRFDLHPATQQFAAEKLELSVEPSTTRRQHAQYFLALAEKATPELTGKRQAEWLNRLTMEHDNIRAVLEWTLEKGDVETALGLAGAIWRFWFMRGYWNEGRRWLGMGLMQDARGSPTVRAKALEGCGVLASNQGDYASAHTHYEEALALRRALNDRPGIATVQNSMGLLAQRQGDYARAVMLYEESLGLKRELGDQWGIAATLNNLGYISQQRGEYGNAQPLLEESLKIYRELGDMRGSTFPLTNLGIVAGCLGDYARAATYHDESLTILRELGDQRGIATACINLGEATYRQNNTPRAIVLFEEALRVARELSDRWMMAHALGNLGDLAQAQNDYRKGAAFYKESLGLRHAIGDKEGIARCLEGLGQVAGAQDQPERAARIFASAEALREAIHAPLEPGHHARHERDCGTVRAQLDAASFTAAWTEGRALTLEQAIAFALQER